MSLRTVSVSRCLDKKMQIAGFEVPDLLAVFFLLSTLNFLFGKTDQKLILIWLPSIILAVVLRVSKRGKPDNYLVHFMRFHLRSRSLFAFHEPSNSKSIPRV
jgi:hypothetical protein